MGNSERLAIVCGEACPASKRLEARAAAERIAMVRCPDDVEVVLAVCQRLRPSLLIASFRFLASPGRPLILQLMNTGLDVLLLAIADRYDEQVIEEAIRFGCRGILEAPCSPIDLIRASRAVLAGEIWAPRRVVSTLLVDLLRRTSSRSEHGLTERETELYELVSKGHSTAEIAAKLFISQETVRWHKRRLYRKLGKPRKGSASTVFRKPPIPPAQNG